MSNTYVYSMYDTLARAAKTPNQEKLGPPLIIFLAVPVVRGFHCLRNRFGLDVASHIELLLALMKWQKRELNWLRCVCLGAHQTLEHIVFL